MNEIVFEEKNNDLKKVHWKKDLLLNYSNNLHRDSPLFLCLCLKSVTRFQTWTSRNSILLRPPWIAMSFNCSHMSSRNDSAPSCNDNRAVLWNWYRSCPCGPVPCRSLTTSLTICWNVNMLSFTETVRRRGTLVFFLFVDLVIVVVLRKEKWVQNLKTDVSNGYFTGHLVK